ncbi:2-hydroxyacyl-CoA dehydratase family protein [Pseudobacteroides cellulosolvens]|uniref:2-hydroxyglutaryl-CoA dehydratase D-component n=1 Tax=Pseudobacteroides cellulosolvens ATCC 35603 = DSM 2933 TaxID=398512 RepID=A0A0L6JNG7_9FIRM|nr:2-hydroxyacyl-CoA dehydratase [Pseudobacteroides cellulosolvens]KNY27275.1 2-hydroxyglutaryl-CoA dehydratase D-component [Pseudobacteroides cellulosolvens ATCC 35603 = DSM 2933]
MKKIGFTTSIPVEIIFAAGMIPVDLNNVFITAESPQRNIENAENAGFPRNTCAWIKGIYSGVVNCEDIDTIIGVVEGDCSNAKALMEVLELKGITAIPFAYPSSDTVEKLGLEIRKLCEYFNVAIDECNKVKDDLDNIRNKLVYLDELTWKHNKATGFENHLWQVSSSDFNGDYKVFSDDITNLINKIEGRRENKNRIRLGYIGVPPIYTDLYDFVEEKDARIVYNEVQRQFTMADSIGIRDLVKTYSNFTYPYSLSGRLNDIKKQIELRSIDAIIHYTQSFCFRGIEDIVIRKELGVPVLTLEGDKPGNIDARTKLRIEAFIEMLK